MNLQHDAWQRLAAAARNAPDLRDEAAPYGFATRVVALSARRPAESAWGAFERFALRGLLAACVVSAAAIAFGFKSFTGEDEEVFAPDTVSEILTMS